MAAFRGTRLGVVALSLALGAWPARAEKVDFATARLSRRLVAVRTTGAITVDGVLDEPDWRGAPAAGDFVQSEPQQGELATERTEVRVLYDADNLYVGIWAFDRDPSGIIIGDLKKDFTSTTGDSVVLIIDTFHDERNAYQLAVNPGGARNDAQVFNEGRDLNMNWDGVWAANARVTREGWFAEMAIPFRTLKFSTAGDQTWGLNIMRRVRRRAEDAYWSPLPRMYNIGRAVSLAGTLEGLRGLRTGRNLRFRPFGLTSGLQIPGRTVQKDANGGFDAKWGVTTGLTWDFTVNTDFSQVEADEQQINLTRFSLLFPEKRDFFLENAGIFQFGFVPDKAKGPGSPPESSETTGGIVGGRQNLQDPILFFSRRIGLVEETGDAIPILAGSRLTGRMGRSTLGVLNIQQRRDGPSPATNFAAVRFRQDVFRNSDIGVIALNKEAAGSHDNRVIGSDVNFRFGNFNAHGMLAGAFTPSRAPSVSTGGNLMTRAGAGWRDNFWEARGSFLTVGERFDDELGFIQRRGIEKEDLFVGGHWRPKATSAWLREIFPHWAVVNLTRTGGSLDSRYFDWHLPVSFQNSATLELGVNRNVEDIATPFRASSRPGATIARGRYGFNEYFAYLSTNTSARLAVTARSSFGGFYDGRRSAFQVGLTGRANEQLNVSAAVSRSDLRLPAGLFRTYLLTGRVNVGFSTRTFINALLQYNTDARQWSANVRFNVIYRPLSEFFLVFNERRDSRSGDLINRSIIAKLTYLLAF